MDSGEVDTRQNSAVSKHLPYLDPKKVKENERSKLKPDDNRMYSPDDELNIDDFMKNLEEGNLKLTKELEEWRQKYGIQLEQIETENILKGSPSLTDLGLSTEEQSIANVVVKGKMEELNKMSLAEVVDYVRLSSY